MKLVPMRTGVKQVPKSLSPVRAPLTKQAPHADYPPRRNMQTAAYKPVEFTHLKVFEQDAKRGKKGWADPIDPVLALKRRTLITLTGKDIEFTRDGRPVNPIERTGYSGRGLLGRWGPNHAADPVITRRNGETGQLEMWAIVRGDARKHYAAPGGMLDKGEAPVAAAARELREETGVRLNLSKAKVLYSGYAVDPRNTDNAWMETTAVHIHVSEGVGSRFKPRAMSDAHSVGWLPLTESNLKKLYGSHQRFARLAMGNVP
ncbi:MAG: NUDIX domain-containing protein [Myxococcaceae bacterium]|nr:NUDIX domain-containing protein [Myxococcaceae bacterium]